MAAVRARSCLFCLPSAVSGGESASCTESRVRFLLLFLSLDVVIEDIDPKPSEQKIEKFSRIAAKAKCSSNAKGDFDLCIVRKVLRPWFDGPIVVFIKASTHAWPR